MSKSRRGFFRALMGITAVSGLSTLGRGLGLTAKIDGIDSKTTTPEFQVSGFPVRLSVRYFFPQNKSHHEAQNDIKSWADQKSFREVYDAFSQSGKVSTTTRYSYEKDHQLFEMFFKDMESYRQYSQLMSEKGVVNVARQSELGYRVTSEVS